MNASGVLMDSKACRTHARRASSRSQAFTRCVLLEAMENGWQGGTAAARKCGMNEYFFDCKELPLRKISIWQAAIVLAHCMQREVATQDAHLIQLLDKKLKKEMIDPTDSVTRSIPHPVRLDFASERRTYSVALDRDLFDQWSVTRSWAGKDNNLRGRRITHVDSFEDGLAMLRTITTHREKHGYQIRSPLIGST